MSLGNLTAAELALIRFKGVVFFNDPANTDLLSTVDADPNTLALNLAVLFDTVGGTLKAEFAAGGVAEADIAAAAVTKTKLAGGFSKMERVAGQDETGDTTIPVAGLAAGDELVGVLVFATAAAIATMVQRANADFTVGAGNLTVVANAANNTGNIYLIIWNDLT